MPIDYNTTQAELKNEPLMGQLSNALRLSNTPETEKGGFERYYKALATIVGLGGL